VTPTVEAVRFAALGTTAELVVTDAGVLGPARAVLEAEVAAVDQACSRFRDDSELALVNQAAGEWVAVSPVFLDALDAARRVARLTGGVIDPTVGAALRLIGYDRDFASVAVTGGPLRVRFTPVPGWQTVEVDRAARCVRVPRGAALDLGASAKAWCADRAAGRAAALAGCGVLVSLGGDVAVAGPAPDGGWPVVIGDDHRTPLDEGGPVVAIWSGGLATSGVSARQWSRGGVALHHIIDPSTGAPARVVWRTASVAAASCLDANAAATAAVVLGDRAVEWLSGTGLPARLVATDGTVTTVGGWR
jgi:thiamine biosynthesis lipoprotein